MAEDFEIPEAPPQTQTGEIDKLYDVVKGAGLYTKSKDEFKQKYSTPDAINKLYDVTNQAGLYTKSKDDFYQKYYPDVQKKSGAGTSQSLATNSLSPSANTDFTQQGQQLATGAGLRNVNSLQAPTGNIPQAVKVPSETNLPDIKEATDNAVQQRIKAKRGVYDATMPKPTKEEVAKETDFVNSQIKNGNLVPDKNSKGESVLKRGTGFLESFGNAVEDEHKQALENTYVANLPKDKAIEYLNNKRQHPDIMGNTEKETAPNGVLGEVGNFLGSNIGMIGKGTVGAIGGSLAAPATGGGSFGTFLATAKDMAHAGYANALEKNYNGIKTQHPEMSDAEAFDKAHNAALVGEAVNIGQGAILAHSLPTPKASIPATSVLESLGHAIKTSPKVVGSSAVGSLLNDITSNVSGNKVSGDEMSKNALEQAKNMAVMHFGLWGLTEPGRIPSYIRPQIENVVASAPREEVKQFYNGMEQQGALPEGTTNKVLSKLDEFDKQKTVVNDMPLSEEQKASITGKLLQRKKIEEENSTLKNYGGSFNARVEANNKQLEGIDSEIDGIIKTGNVARFEKDNLTGEPLTTSKAHDELTKQEREGIVVPKEHGYAEVEEKGEGENKTYVPKAYETVKEGGLEKSKPIKIETDKTFKEKESAQKVADEALGKHYYENAMQEHEKPLSKTKSEEPLPSTVKSEGFKSKTDSELEQRQNDLEKQISEMRDFDKAQPLHKEFNDIDKELEKREKDSVFNVPLDKASNSIDAIMKKEKEQPNGYGSYMDKSDARQSKSVIEKYINPKEIPTDELMSDFKEALMGRPTTWTADGLQLRESAKEAANRGITFDDLLKVVEKEFTKDGHSEEVAKQVIARYLKPIFEGSKTETINEKQLSNETTKDTKQAEAEKQQPEKLSENSEQSEKNEKQQAVNDLVDRAQQFQKMRKNEVGRVKELNDIRNKAAELGLEYRDATGKIHNKNGTQVQKKELITNKTPFQGYDRNKYSPETNNAVDNLTVNDDAISGLPILGTDGKRLSAKQRADALKSIREGKPTHAGKAIIDFIDKAVSEGGIEIEDVTSGQRVKVPLNEYMEAFKEPVKEMTDAEYDEINNQLANDSFEHHLDNLIKQIEHENVDRQNQTSNTGTTKTSSEGTDSKENTAGVGAEAQGGNKVGISHNSLTDLAKKLGLGEPERGTRLNPEQLAERGRLLYNAGADMEALEKAFKDGKQPTSDDISVARAHLETLTKTADAMGKKFGYESRQYQEAKNEVARWNKEVVKPMGTEASVPFTALQGERDLDTDSFTVVRSKVEEAMGKQPSKEQDKKIEELTKTNEILKQRADEAEAKLVQQTDEELNKKETTKPTDKTYKEKAKKAADSFRKLKTKEFTFKDENGNDVPLTKMGISWNDLVEIGAKAIEKTGEIADGIKAIVDEIRDTEFYKKLSDKEKGNLEKQLTDHYTSENKKANTLEELQKQFVDKTDNKFTREEAKSIWDYAKETYLDKGVKYRDMISLVADDLGLTWRQVSEAITTPKTKRTSDEMWKKQSEYKRNQNATKRWVNEQSDNKYVKALKSISGKIRGLSVFGHGGIFIGTHAGMTFFQPSTWKYTIPAFFRAWKFAYGNTGNYERAMEELRNRDNYTLAQRAGLKNNPDILNAEEFQKSQQFLGKLGGAGEHGFNSIKVLRQDLFDNEYNKLSAADKADPAVSESIARLINNATGATNLTLPEWVNEASFAGGMEAARWGKLTRNPVKATEVALKALTNPESVSAADKVFAKVWAKRVGQQLGTFTGALIANAAIQNMINPKNATNLTDPSKSDWMKFKIGDITIDPTSGMLGVINFIKGLGQISVKDQKELKGDSRMQAYGKKIIGYARGKAAPLYSKLADLAFQSDFNGNPLPWSKDKPQAGRHTLSGLEYALQFAPLPIAEAANVTYQSAQETGDKKLVDNVMKGIMLGAISGGTGFRVGETHDKPTPFTESDNKEPAFKYFLDKGLELPNTSPTSEVIKDEEAGVKKKLSEYPKEKQDEYATAHKDYLKQNLEKVIERGYVYVDKFGDVSINPADKHDQVDLSDLKKEQLAQVLHLSQASATQKAKKDVFKSE